MIILAFAVLPDAENMGCLDFFSSLCFDGNYKHVEISFLRSGKYETFTSFKNKGVTYLPDKKFTNKIHKLFELRLDNTVEDNLYSWLSNKIGTPYPSLLRRGWNFVCCGGPPCNLACSGGEESYTCIELVASALESEGYGIDGRLPCSMTVQTLFDHHSKQDYWSSHANVHEIDDI